MKLERTKNTARNLKFGVLLKLFTVLIPFVMRTVMLHVLGVEYLGLSSLFSSILQTLNIAELGVNSAMVFSMYKAIAKDDGDMICALMKLYRRYYRIIGSVIAVAGIALLPFLRCLTSGNVPQDINIYILYLLELSTTVFTYWLFSYKNCLLAAFQRDDISSKIGLLVGIVRSGLQLLAIWLLKNYYAYLSIALVLQIATNIITAIVVSRMFPRYEPRGEVDQENKKLIHGRIRDLFFSKIAGTIVNSSDTLVISAFLGLRLLALYQNYYYLMSSVIGFIMIISSSALAGIGNSLLTETKEKNYNDFKKLSFMMMWLITVCTSCFLCMYQPFMKLWVGEDNLFDFGMMALFCVYFFVFMIQKIGIIYKDASGIWRDDRNRTILTALTNLVLNIVLVQIMGIYAIILSTVASYLFLGTPWLIRNLFKLVFNSSPKEYVIILLKHTAVTVICVGLCFGICYLISRFLELPTIITVLLNGAVCMSVSNLILYFVYRKQNTFTDVIVYGKRFFKS